MKKNNNYIYALLFAVLTLAFAIRLLHIRYGLPYKWADDAKIFHFANIMIYDKNLIPEYFKYGSVSMYIQAIVMFLIGAVSKLLVVLGFSAPTLNKIADSFLIARIMIYQLNFEFGYYSVLLGRAVFTAFSVFSGYFVYKILRRCTDNYFISFVGLVLNASLFIQFQYGIVLRQENISLFFLTVMAFITIAFYDDPSRRRAILLGVISALCVTTEYSLAPLLIVPMAVYWIKGGVNAGSLTITNVEIKCRTRQLILLSVIALSAYSFFVNYVANTLGLHRFRWYGDENPALMNLWPMKYKLALWVIIATFIMSLIVFIVYKYYLRDSKRINRWASALIGSNRMPYYFLYGFLPVAIFFNMGFFRRPLYYGHEIFGSLLPAYTNSFGIYTLKTGQMIRQIADYLANEQMGYIYILLILSAPLAFLNKKIDKQKKKKMAIIISFVAIMMSFLASLHLFYAHRFIAISSLQVCIVSFSLFNIYVALKDRSRIAACIVVILVSLLGAYPHINKAVRLSEVARPPDTRTLAASWLGNRTSFEDIVVIDKALFMQSVDLSRNDLKVVFADIDERLFNKLKKEGICPSYIVTTNRQISESEYEKTYRLIRPQLIFDNLIYKPFYRTIFESSFYDLDFLGSAYTLKKIFIKDTDISPKGSYYMFPILLRVSIKREEKAGSPPISYKQKKSPSVMCNPDILIFERIEHEKSANSEEKKY